MDNLAASLSTISILAPSQKGEIIPKCHANGTFSNRRALCAYVFRLSAQPSTTKRREVLISALQGYKIINIDASAITERLTSLILIERMKFIMQASDVFICKLHVCGVRT